MTVFDDTQSQQDLQITVRMARAIVAGRSVYVPIETQLRALAQTVLALLEPQKVQTTEEKFI